MISIITPTNDTQFLPEAAESLRAQTFQDFTWIILLNGEAKDVPESVKEGLDVNVVFAKDCPDGGNIGSLKGEACRYVDRPYTVELDHDDLLTPDALEEVLYAFDTDDDLSLVYSNFAEFFNGTWDPHVYNTRFGWRYRDFTCYNRLFKEALCFPPSAHSIASILFAPNHIRAWRTEHYKAVGGHDATLPVADDHDLVCRLYLYGKVRHIDKCLYLYRIHDTNSWRSPGINSEIKKRATANRDKYLVQMVERWAELAELPMVDICSGPNPPPGYMGIDRRFGPVVADLNITPWPLSDNSVGVVRAVDALEHLRDPVAIMSEIYRVLVPGGWLLSQTPSTDGRGAFQDPTHVSFWNEHSFWYWTQKRMAAYVGHSVRFQSVRYETFFHNDWNREHNIPYVRADLVALKGDYRAPGLVAI